MYGWIWSRWAYAVALFLLYSSPWESSARRSSGWSSSSSSSVRRERGTCRLHSFSQRARTGGTMPSSLFLSLKRRWAGSWRIAEDRRWTTIGIWETRGGRLLVPELGCSGFLPLRDPRLDYVPGVLRGERADDWPAVPWDRPLEILVDGAVIMVPTAACKTADTMETFSR